LDGHFFFPGSIFLLEHPAVSWMRLLVFSLAISWQTVVAQETPSVLRVQAVMPEGAGIAGALVAAIADDGRVVAEGITDAEGFRSLQLPPGKYTVRVRRIGYQPFSSGEITVPYSGTLKLVTESRRVMLETVVVMSSSSCRNDERDKTGISTVWDEISKALVGSEVTRRDLANLGTLIRYKKKVERKIVKADTTRTTIAGDRPFAAVDPVWLSRTGYVHGNVDIGFEYYAPDEAVLLSREFANTHCFRIVRNNKRKGQVGLNFEPSPGRRLPEISGTLWLNEKSSELIEIEFRFVNVGAVEEFKPGGKVHFMRMSSGAWLVDNWYMRFPLLELQMGAYRDALKEIGYSEDGGAITQIPVDR
jgi:hypothetical protein